MSLIDDAKAAVGNVFCAAFQGYDDSARWSAGLFYPDRVGDVYPRSPAGGLAETGLSLFCDRQPFEPPAPPFSGGQCPAEYTVRWVVDRYFNGQLAQEGQEQSAGFGVTGPIYRVYQSDNQRITLADTVEGNGIALTSNSSTSVTYRNLRNVVVTRRDGQPDDCGDPEENYEPLPPSDRTRPINIGGNNGIMIFGNGNLLVNGDFVVPFSVDAGALNFTGEMVLNTGDVNLNFGGQPTNPPCEEETPTPDGDPSDPEEPEEPEEGPSDIVGVIVVVSETGIPGKATEVLQQNSPNLFVPRMGHVAFKLKIGDKFHWTSDISVKNKNNFIPNPGGYAAVRVEGTPNTGYEFELTPVRGLFPASEVEV